MKKIICPTDFSETADKAMQYAAAIARQAKAHLTLLHVIHLPIVDTSETAIVATEIMGEQRRDAHKRLEMLVRQLQEQHGTLYSTGFSCDFVVQEALLTDAVQVLIEDQEYDLVVMGTTGAGGKLEEILVGSNAEAIMENVPCPVLSIPRKAFFKQFRRIIFASDFNDKDIQALKEVFDLAQLFQATVEVVHVCKNQDDLNSEKSRSFKNKLINSFQGFPVTFKEIVNENEEKGLNKYLHEQNADLLAVLRKKKNFFRELFSQSLTEKMTYHSQLPLLIVHGNPA